MACGRAASAHVRPLLLCIVGHRTSRLRRTPACRWRVVEQRARTSDLGIIAVYRWTSYTPPATRPACRWRVVAQRARTSDLYCCVSLDIVHPACDAHPPVGGVCSRSERARQTLELLLCIVGYRTPRLRRTPACRWRVVAQRARTSDLYCCVSLDIVHPPATHTRLQVACGRAASAHVRPLLLCIVGHRFGE